MDFLLNISSEDFIINKAHHSLTDDDLAYAQKDNLNFSSDNLGQSSLNGWSPLPILIGRSEHNRQNPIPFIPNQNYDPLNRNLVTTQNILVCNPPIVEIPSKYPFMDIDSYSNTNSFEESMNNLTNNNLWDDTIHNKGLITRGYEPTLDNFVVESHPFDILVPEGTKSTSKKIINQHQNRGIIQTDQEKNKNVVRRSKPLKKTKIIKGKWTKSEDKNLKKTVELYGTKKWGMIAKRFDGRVGKQCRERWHNHLRPDIKKNVWTEEEDQIFIETHKVAGNKWTKIAQLLPGRSENAIKNRWNATKRRMQLMKTKQSDENENPPHNNILENYIKDVTINNDPSKATETDHGITENAKDDCDSRDVFDGEMNLSLDVTTLVTEPVVDASTTSIYVQEPATFSWDDYIAELFESIDDPEMLMQGWE